MPWWYLEVLFRLEPRLEWKDIDVLMEHVGQRAKQPDRQKYINSWNNILRRGREDFSMVAWREKSKNEKSNKTRDKVLGALSQGQIRANTTRSLPSGLNLQGNQAPMQSGPGSSHRSSNATVTISTVAAKSDASTRMPARRSRAASLYASEEVADDETEGDDVAARLPPALTLKRKRAIDAGNAIDSSLQASPAPEFETGVRSSRIEGGSNNRTRNDQQGVVDIANISNSHGRERQRGLNPDAYRSKKQRMRGKNDLNDSLMDPLCPSNGFPLQANPNYTTEAQRQVRHHRERNRRLGRQSAQATSAAIESSQAQMYTRRAPYPISQISSYQALDDHTGSYANHGNTMGFDSNVNAARDSSLRGIANELGLAPSFYGEAMDQVQNMYLSGGYVNPLRRYSDPPAVSPYQSINNQGSFADEFGQNQPQNDPPRKASDPLGSFSYGNAYGSLVHQEHAGQGQYFASPDCGQIQQSSVNDPYITDAGDFIADPFPDVSYAIQPVVEPQSQIDSPVGANGYVESLAAEVDAQHIMRVPEVQNQTTAATIMEPFGDRRPAGETASPTTAGFYPLPTESEADILYQADALPQPSQFPASLNDEWDAYFNFD